MRNVRHGISKSGKDSNAKRTPWDGNKTKKTPTRNERFGAANKPKTQQCETHASGETYAFLES